MSTPTQDAKQKTAATYNAASDVYDHPANSFWDHFGRRTVERLELPLGGRVLDVCCGFINRGDIRTVEANVLYGVATKATSL